jgi:hypothetical protein
MLVTLPSSQFWLGSTPLLLPPPRWHHFFPTSLPHEWHHFLFTSGVTNLSLNKNWSNQGILKGEVSHYCWPPVWLVWNQLYDNWQFLFLFAKQTNPNQSNRRSMVQWYLPPLVFPGPTYVVQSWVEMQGDVGILTHLADLKIDRKSEIGRSI